MYGVHVKQMPRVQRAQQEGRLERFREAAPKATQIHSMMWALCMSYGY